MYPTRTSTVTTHRVAHRQWRPLPLLATVLVTGLLVTGCGAGGGSRPTVAPASPHPTTAAPASPSAPATPLVVRTDHPLALHQAPDAASPARDLAATTELGSQTALLVTGQRDGWVQVLVPGRPTGGTAWVATADVELRPVTTEVRVDLATKTLTVLDGGRTVLTTPVAIGAPATPTPEGRFSITDKLDTQNAGGAYGPYAIGLSGRSEVLTEFGGGDGQIGIHGTNDPGSIGQAVSHGCIRVPNDVIEQLNGILPLGTPVVVG